MKIVQIVLFLGLIKSLHSMDCEITAVYSYYYCVGICREKYGMRGNNTKQFFNRTSKLCEPQVVCDNQRGQYYVDYENRCDNLYDDAYPSQIRGILTTFDTFVFSKAIVPHGSKASGPPDGTLCYPGYKSSFKTGKGVDIQGQYQTVYYCDLRLNDESVPLSYGQHYFNLLPNSQRRDALDLAYGVNFSAFLYFFGWLLGWMLLLGITLLEIFK